MIDTTTWRTLIYGIPNFKLEKFVVERRTNLLKESGIKFVQNFEVVKTKHFTS